MAIQVEFKVSGKKVPWDASYETLLDLAEANGIEIETECEAGICGTRKVKLLSGKVEMEVEDGLDDDEKEQNFILPCVSVPLTDVVLDL